MAIDYERLRAYLLEAEDAEMASDGMAEKHRHIRGRINHVSTQIEKFEEYSKADDRLPAMREELELLRVNHQTAVAKHAEVAGRAGRLRLICSKLVDHARTQAGLPVNLCSEFGLKRYVVGDE